MYSKELRELIADLLYRGDYSPDTRKYLQKAIISEDPVKLKAALKKIPNVPSDRAKRREQLLDKMIKIDAKSSNIIGPLPEQRRRVFQGIPYRNP